MTNSDQKLPPNNLGRCLILHLERRNNFSISSPKLYIQEFEKTDLLKSHFEGNDEVLNYIISYDFTRYVVPNCIYFDMPMLIF